MEKLNAMRPQDIVVLLGILAMGPEPWQQKDLARKVCLSPAEITQSLERSKRARLLDESKRKVRQKALLEFLKHGLRYVYPVEPGPMVRGIPTAHSAPPMKPRPGSVAEILSAIDVPISVSEALRAIEPTIPSPTSSLAEKLQAIEPTPPLPAEPPAETLHSLNNPLDTSLTGTFGTMTFGSQPFGAIQTKLSKILASPDDTYVWPSDDGNVRGHAITPLYPTVPDAAKADLKLYAFLALVEALRVGRAREREQAIRYLEALLEA